jgi:hypothetical protein
MLTYADVQGGFLDDKTKEVSIETMLLNVEHKFLATGTQFKCFLFTGAKVQILTLLLLQSKYSSAGT